MPTFFFLLLLFTTTIILVSSSQKTQPNIIPLGSSLTPVSNSTWSSPSALFAFGFFPQNHGYAVGIFLAAISGPRTVVWTANVENRTVSKAAVLQLTRTGKLVVQQKGIQLVEVAETSTPIGSASMLDDGNLVLYSATNLVIWQSFDYPTNTLLPGQRLLAGTSLFSSASNDDYSRGPFQLTMQEDGNLVQYPLSSQASSDAYYSSRTFRRLYSITLNLDTDGSLYLLERSSIVLNITEGNPTDEQTFYLLRIDVDGIFRLYSHSLQGDGNWKVSWASSTDKCDPKGLCGINSFCNYTSERETSAGYGGTKCDCLPGFYPVQLGNRTAGCHRDFTAQTCGVKGVVKFKNTTANDNSYNIMKSISEENCTKACVEECKCDIAIYTGDSNCLMQTLPLIYGRESTSSEGIIILKVRGRSSMVAPASPLMPTSASTKEIKKVVPFDIVVIQVSFIVASILIMTIYAVYFHGKHGDNNNNVTSKKDDNPSVDVAESGKASLVRDISIPTSDHVI